jgi:hypothetical protein
MTNKRGTPLMAAAGLGRVPGENVVKQSDVLAAVRLPIELNALGNVNAIDDIGNTLHYAAYFRRNAIIQAFVEQGCGPQHREQVRRDASLVV